MPARHKSAPRSIPIRILVADDHDVVRHCIKAILARREGWDVCAEAKSGPETIALAEKYRPDVMVMDLNMPGLGGVETLREVKRRVPSVHVVVLTLHYSDPLVRAVVDAGALGYVMKSDADRDLVAAVEAISLGKTHFTPIAESAGQVRNTVRRPASPQPSPTFVVGQLSNREREAVRSLAQTMRKLL